MNTIPFWKMHGAANDFILVDDREQTFPAHDRDWLAQIVSRNTGVGSEGFILIQPSDRADFKMRFFNPDGNEAEMCGNGARCVARLAHEIGAAPPTMSIETMAGVVQAELKGEIVQLRMTDPTDWKMHQQLKANDTDITYHFVNSGVPHVVMETEEAKSVDLLTLGSTIRHHPAFAPQGTNVNFISLKGADTLRVRTYERGVEGETPACGTGIVASALIAGKLGRVGSPVRIISTSGNTLEVHFMLTEKGAEEVILMGPAVHVFEGIVRYP